LCRRSDAVGRAIARWLDEKRNDREKYIADVIAQLRAALELRAEFASMFVNRNLLMRGIPTNC